MQNEPFEFIAMNSLEKKFTVPFYDLDPMQVVWHGNYLKYFDTTREELCHELGFDPVKYYKRTNILFPIIKTSTKHIVSLRHRDQFTCKAVVKEAHYKIVVDFEIRLNNNGILCAKGRSEQVAVKYPETEILFEIPDDIRKTLGL